MFKSHGYDFGNMLKSHDVFRETFCQGSLHSTSSIVTTRAAITTPILGHEVIIHTGLMKLRVYKYKDE